jgi:hypothetical protein
MTSFRQEFVSRRVRRYLAECAAFVVAAFAAVVVALSAQQVGSSRTALAEVLDANNKPIVDIEADDFVVQEAGQPREILSVHVADYPIVVMVDVGRAAQSDLPFIQRAVARFLERIGEQRPVALGIYGDHARIVAGFDAERSRLIERLSALSVSDSMESVAMEGAAEAARTASSTGAIFSAAIVVASAGSDDRSARVDELIGPIVGSGTMVHVIANRADRFSPPQAPGMVAALRSLADQTRGGYTTIYSAASYQVALEQLANRLATELMVEYLVPNNSRAADVKLGVRIPGVRVRGLGVAPR